MRTMQSCYAHRCTTTFCQALFLHSWIISNRYSFCDAYCHGHTESTPERTIGSILASPLGRYPEQTCDSDPQLALQTCQAISLPYLDRLENWWKEAPSFWFGLLAQLIIYLQAYCVILVRLLLFAYPFLMPRSPLYHCGHLKCVISILVATRVSNQQPANFFTDCNTLRGCKSNWM